MPVNTPTESELEILNILWDEGRLTVRQVHDALQKLKSTNYATTVKVLSVMHEKGFVHRDQSVRPQIYRAAISRNATQKRVLREMANQVFSGSYKSLVLQALSGKKHSAEELEEISQIVEELKKHEAK